jgi:hypothetical protein
MKKAHCLVQVIAFNSMALGGEDHRRLTARYPKDVQHVKAVERVLDDVVVPGKVADHHVKPQAITDRTLNSGLVLSDPHRGVTQRLQQQGLDDLSQCCGDQQARPVSHSTSPWASVAPSRELGRHHTDRIFRLVMCPAGSLGNVQRAPAAARPCLFPVDG